MAAKKMFPPGEVERLLGRSVQSPSATITTRLNSGSPSVSWLGKP
jgi:hypothetical protein